MKVITPMEFQVELMDKFKQTMLFNQYRKRVILQSPTGSGKSIVGSLLAKDMAQKGHKVCILVHRREIFKSFFETLLAVGITPSLIVPGQKVMVGQQVYLGMEATVKRRETKGLIKHLGVTFFIGDEIHLGNYYKFIKDLKVDVGGMTATPKSTGKPELHEYFDDIVVGPSTQHLIDIGRLVQGKTYSVEHDFSHLKKAGGDFDEKQLRLEFKKPVLYDGAVKSYLKNAHSEKALCYCVDIEHSKETMCQFLDAGIPAFHVDGEMTDAERDFVFRRFQQGDIKVLCNVGVATTGTDIPDVQTIIVNRATMSLVLWKQMIGRGGRSHPGKDSFKIIDMGRNWVRHGHFHEDPNWAYIFGHPSEAIKKEGKRNDCKTCPACTVVISVRDKTCPWCSHIFTEESIESFIQTHGTAEEIKDLRLSRLPIHLRKPLSELNLRELIDYGKVMGYKPGWAHIQYSFRPKESS